MNKVIDKVFRLEWDGRVVQTVPVRVCATRCASQGAEEKATG